MIGRIGKVNLKLCICPACRLDFSFFAISDRFMVSRYKEKFDLGVCTSCYMLGFTDRQSYIDWKRSYPKV